MASALIPLAIQAVPSIIDLIVSLVHKHAPAAEQLGPGTGPVKFATVFDQVIASLQQAATVGTIPKDLPTDETIKAIIQVVVTSMQKLGLLNGTVTSAPPAAPAIQGQTITIRAGQTLVITGA